MQENCALHGVYHCNDPRHRSMTWAADIGLIGKILFRDSLSVVRGSSECYWTFGHNNSSDKSNALCRNCTSTNSHSFTNTDWLLGLWGWAHRDSRATPNKHWRGLFLRPSRIRNPFPTASILSKVHPSVFVHHSCTRTDSSFGEATIVRIGQRAFFFSSQVQRVCFVEN